MFTDKDNEAIMKVLTKAEIKQILQASNHHAAPGSDGLTSYFYPKCFDIMGDTLTEVVQNIFRFEKPSTSQRTCQMVFANKPIKPNSKKLIENEKSVF